MINHPKIKMKFYKIIFISLLVVLISCNQTREQTTLKTKTFNEEEQALLAIARKVIDSAYFATVITINNKGEAKARIMEPFKPEKDFSIYLATNPKTRKLKEIKENNAMTLHYFDRNNPGYVSLIGKVEIINDSITKSQYFKKGWEAFYANRTDAYTLLKFTPKQLELISIRDKKTGDKTDWKPEIVHFY